MKKIYFVKLFLTCFISILCLAAGAQPATLKAHYLLDETSGTVASDASGNGFDGTIGGTVNWVEGTLGGALEFMGNDSVVLPAAAMEMTSDNGSVAFWMNAGVPVGINTMFWAGDNAGGGGFGPENEMHIHLEEASDSWSGGELTFFAVTTASDQFIFLYSDPAKGGAAERANPPVNPILLGDQQWHHVAATWGNGNAKMYIDGSKVMESAYASGGYHLTHMYLGQMANAGRTYIGKLDDVRIYSGILNDTEISFLFLKITNVEDTKVNDLTELAAYPNPATNNLNIRFFSHTSGKASVSLVSMTGQVLETVELDAVPDYNYVSFDANKYSQGIYFIDLEVEGNTSHTKVVIE